MSGIETAIPIIADVGGAVASAAMQPGTPKPADPKTPMPGGGVSPVSAQRTPAPMFNRGAPPMASRRSMAMEMLKRGGGY